MPALAKSKKNAAGAAQGKKPDKAKKKKRGKKSGKGRAAPAAPPQPREPQRAAGGVPPVEAFDTLPRRQPPSLAGPGQEAPPPEAMAAKPQKQGKRSSKKKAAPEAPPTEPQRVERKRKPRAVTPARIRLRRRILAVLACVALIALGVWFSLSILFKIDKYEVQGECAYTVEQLAEAFGHAQGDNMFGYVKSNAEERIMTQLPYVEKVVVRRRLPSTIVFRVTPAREVYCFESAEGFVVLNESRKVLRVAAEAPEGLVQIYGLEQMDAQPGHVLALLDEKTIKANLPEPTPEPESEPAQTQTGGDGGGESEPAEGPAAPKTVEQTSAERAAEEAENSEGEGEAGEGETGEEPPPEPEPEPEKPPEPLTYEAVVERFEVMGVLLEALKEAGLEGIDWIDVSDPLDLKFGWEGRITVRLGPQSGLDEKLATVAELLGDKVTEHDRGTLDMGLYLATGQSYFKPE